MKTIKIEIDGTKFRIFEDGTEIENVKQFMVKGGRKYCPSMELELELCDNNRKKLL